MNRLLTLFALLTVTALAADVSGTWKGTIENGPNGPMERTFHFKVDGNKLTGDTTSSLLGKSEIAEGKIDGDNLSFSITADLQGNEVKIQYEGKVHGDQITLTSKVAGNDQSYEWHLKKGP